LHHPHLSIGAGLLLGLALMQLMCFAGSAQAQTSHPAAPTAVINQSATSCVIAPRPNSLWSLAQCCSRNLHSNSGCRAYDAADEYIILKDNSPAKPAAYLIIPSIRVTGIDDKQIFMPPIVDFWEYGWQQAQILVKKPPDDIALAINSVYGRSQNQLHIHMACVLPAVARSLAAHAGNIGTNPSTPVHFPLGPADHLYRVVKTTGLVDEQSPFKLAAAMPGARDAMVDQSIAVIGSNTPGTYYILDTEARGDNHGAAEELLDQTCGG
jgi:CDP-diacylglycerol pyrophosphatase